MDFKGKDFLKQLVFGTREIVALLDVAAELKA